MKSITALVAVPLLMVACTTAPPAPLDPPVTQPAPAETFRQTAPEPLPQRSWSFPEVTRVTLENGLRVLVAENHGAPLTTIRAVIRTGAERDPARQPGLATLTANMLDEGAGQRNAVQIAEAMGALGGQLNTGADWDSSTVNAEVLSRNLEQAMGVFADVVLRPQFPQEDFERIRRERLTTLLQQRDNAGIVANNRFSALVYRDTPYGNPLLGTDAAVQTISRDDVRRFYEGHYAPNNTSLIITGDVNPQQAIELARRHFGAWRRGAELPPVTITAPAIQQNQIYVVDRPQAVQSEIRVGHAGVARSTEDYFPLLVMNTILGGNFGSRLNLNLREQHGYTYGARSGFSYRRSAGPFTVSTPVRNEVTLQSVTEIMNELRRMRSGDLTDAELDAAKNYQMGIFPAMVESASALASRLEEMELHNLPEDYFSRYRERIAAVTDEDVEEVARKYVQPDRTAIVVVGRAEEIREPLSSLGIPVTVHNIDGHPIAP